MEIANRQPHIGQHPEQRLLKLAQIGRARAAVDLDEDQRLDRAVVSDRIRRQQLEQAAVGRAAHL
ncbi:hypothetical protein D3C77_764300 [compost metagenome]